MKRKKKSKVAQMAKTLPQLGDLNLIPKMHMMGVEDELPQVPL